MTPEDRFRHSSDLPPMTPAEFIVGPRPDADLLAGYGWIALILAAGILCIACALISQSNASAPGNDGRLIGLPAVGGLLQPESIDDAFWRFVELESHDCRYLPQGSTLAPVRVCDEGA